MAIKKSFKLILFILFSPIYLESPAFAMQFYMLDGREICYDNFTYDYAILDPYWYIEGNCSRNRLYKINDISLKEAQSWHKSNHCVADLDSK